MYATFLRKPIVPLLYFLLLALAYYMPVTLHWFTAVPGDAHYNDSVMHTWPFWYFPYAISNGLPNLLHPNLQFYPDGISMLYYSSSIVGAIVTSPVSLLWGPMAAVNTWLILQLWLGGWFFYLLCVELGICRLAGILGGTAYMCSPFVGTHLPGHYTLVQIAFPAAILWQTALLLRSNLTSSVMHRALPYTLALSISMLAVSDFYLSVMTAFLLLPVIVHQWSRSTFSSGFAASKVRALGLAGIMALTMVSPWMCLALLHRQGMDYGQLDPVYVARETVNLNSLFIPPINHWLWSYITLGRITNDYVMLDQESGYVGISILLIGLVGFTVGRHWKSPLLWGVALLFFIGLGGGNSYTQNPAWGGTPLNFGTWWPRSFPFGDFRVPTRWLFAIQVCAILLMCLGVQPLLCRPKRKYVIAVSCLILLGLDLWTMHRYGDSGPQRTLVSSRSKTNLGTVLDFDVEIWSGTGYFFGSWDLTPLKRQMTHGRPILTVITARLPVNLFEQRKNETEMNALVRLQRYGDVSVTKGLNWPEFGRRYNITTVRVTPDHIYAEALRDLGDKIVPGLQWKMNDTEWVGESPST